MSSWTLILLVLPASTLATVMGSSGAAASLLRVASVRTHAHGTLLSGLRYSQEDPAARTLLTLDTNRDGRIDPSEVKAFAKMQGLDAESATREFSSIDQNGDGVLDSAELVQVLGADAIPPSASAAQKEVSEVKAAPAPRYKAPVEETNSEVQTAPAPRYKAPAEETNSEVQTAPAEEEESKLTDFIGTEASRAAVRSAAADVAEQLSFEEEEEKAARSLDRKAAEIKANSTALAKLTVQDALDAGATAANDKAVELLADITKLEEQAAKAEVRAAALTAKSKLEAEQAQDLMSVADSALKSKL